MEPLLEGLLRSLGGSEANFLEVCLGRIPCGNFHTKATSKKSRPPFRKLLLEPPQTSEKSLQELFQSGGWLEDCLTEGLRSGPLRSKMRRFAFALLSPLSCWGQVVRVRAFLEGFLEGSFLTKCFLEEFPEGTM